MASVTSKRHAPGTAQEAAAANKSTGLWALSWLYHDGDALRSNRLSCKRPVLRLKKHLTEARVAGEDLAKARGALGGQVAAADVEVAEAWALSQRVGQLGERACFQAERWISAAVERRESWGEGVSERRRQTPRRRTYTDSASDSRP